MTVHETALRNPIAGTATGDGGPGVMGEGTGHDGIGVFGTGERDKTKTARGVVGVAINASGVEGRSTGTGAGVFGRSDQAIGVHGVGGTLAGFFEGNVEVSKDLKVDGTVSIAPDRLGTLILQGVDINVWLKRIAVLEGQVTTLQAQVTTLQGEYTRLDALTDELRRRVYNI